MATLTDIIHDKSKLDVFIFQMQTLLAENKGTEKFLDQCRLVFSPQHLDEVVFDL